MNKSFFALASFRAKRPASLFLCALFFALGIASGHFFSAGVPDSLLCELSQSVNAFLMPFRGVYNFSFSVFLSSFAACIFPLLCFISAFFPFGYIPVLFVSAFRGFLLCFSLSSVMDCIGRELWLFYLIAFGIPELMRLPAFLSFSSVCFESSFGLSRYACGKAILFRKDGRSATLFFSALVCLAVFAAAAITEIIILPVMAYLAAKI